MKKPASRKLVLRGEILRVLAAADLTRAIGGDVEESFGAACTHAAAVVPSQAAAVTCPTV